MPPKSKKKQPKVSVKKPSVSLDMVTSTAVTADGKPINIDLTLDSDDEMQPDDVNPPPQTTSKPHPTSDEGEFIEFGASGLFNDKIKLGKELSEDDMKGHVIESREWHEISARNLWDILHASASKTTDEEEFRRVEGFLGRVCAALNPHKDRKWVFIWKKRSAFLDSHAERQKEMMYNNLLAAIRRHCPKM